MSTFLVKPSESGDDKKLVEPYLKSKGCKRLGLITSTEKMLASMKNKYELLDSMMLEYGTKSIGNWAFVKILDN